MATLGPGRGHRYGGAVATSSRARPPRPFASRGTVAAVALVLCWWPFAMLVWLAVQVRGNADYQFAGGYLLTLLASWILGIALAVHGGKAQGAQGRAWWLFLLCLLPLVLALVRVPSLLAALIA